MVTSRSLLAERDANGVVTVRRMVQHTDKEVGVEGKSQSKVFLGGWGCTQTVRNEVIDVKCNFAGRAGFILFSSMFK